MTHDLILRLATKACNDTLGADGLVPTLLVYGTLPTLPVTNGVNLAQKERMQALSLARDEMATLVAEQRILRALRSKLPPASKYNLQSGDLVRVYWEKERKLLGQVQIVKVEHKIIHVTDGITVKPFSRVQVMPIRTGNKAEDTHISAIHEFSNE